MDAAGIRAFAPADLPALQAIRAAAFAPVFASFRAIVGPGIAAAAFSRAEDEQAALLDRLCAPGSGHDVIVAESGGEVMGFAAYTCNDARALGEIVLTAVHPDRSGRGFGTRLCEECLARMRQRGMKVATVGTGGDPSHAPARRAYAKAGFGPALPSVWLYRTL